MFIWRLPPSIHTKNNSSHLLLTLNFIIMLSLTDALEIVCVKFEDRTDTLPCKELNLADISLDFKLFLMKIKIAYNLHLSSITPQTKYPLQDNNHLYIAVRN